MSLPCTFNLVGSPSEAPPNIKCPPHTDEKSTVSSCQGNSTSITIDDLDVQKQRTEQQLVRPATPTLHSSVKSSIELNVKDGNQKASTVQGSIQGNQN